MPTVQLNGLPRMADFARWAVATEEALGAEQGAFMEAYGASQEEAVGQALEASPIAAPLWRLAREHKGPQNAWTGTATQLLKELSDTVDDEARRAAGWPKAPNSLSRELKRLAPPLRDVGVYAEQRSRSDEKGSRQWCVFYSSPGGSGKTSSEASEASDEKQNTRKTQGSSSDDTSDGIGASDDKTVRTDDISDNTVRDESPANNGHFNDSDDSDGLTLDKLDKKEGEDEWLEI